VLTRQIECYDLTGESSQRLEGTLRAALDKAKSAAPSILLLRNVEALARKSDAPNARPAPIIKVLGDILEGLKEGTGESGLPCVLLGMTAEGDGVDTGVAGCFKQNIELSVSGPPTL
jgi:peroxin-6